MKKLSVFLSLALSASTVLAESLPDATEMLEIFDVAATEFSPPTGNPVNPKIEVNAVKTHFKTVGAVDSFQWAPARYAPSTFRYDIFYYIPAALKNRSNVGALIFGHGGGGSTMDRAGSVRTVGLYMPDLKRLADELGIIVVLPSANGLNWGGHTRGLWRELATKMRKELRIDPNLLGMSGHSMGGMGITRNYLWSADEFAYFLPMAAGMDEKHQTEQHINKVFNVPYVHLQGKKDHFEAFITRTQAQLKNTAALEKKYARKSKFEAIFYEGSHNYDYNLFRNTVKRLMLTPRNLYQKELWGSLHTVKSKLTENNILFDYDSESRYYWVELTDTNLTVAENVSFTAVITGQTIRLTFPVMPKQSKNLRLYLSSKMIDLKKPIQVVLNGKTRLTRPAKAAGTKKVTDPNDPAFVFDDVINLKI